MIQTFKQFNEIFSKEDIKNIIINADDVFKISPSATDLGAYLYNVTIENIKYTFVYDVGEYDISFRTSKGYDRINFKTSKVPIQVLNHLASFIIYLFEKCNKIFFIYSPLDNSLNKLYKKFLEKIKNEFKNEYNINIEVGDGIYPTYEISINKIK